MKFLNFFYNKKVIVATLIFIIAVAALSSLLLKSYTACGCGGCGGMAPRISFTFTPRKVIEDDYKLRGSEICRLLGCSICTKYYYFGW